MLNKEKNEMKYEVHCYSKSFTFVTTNKKHNNGELILQI